MNLKDINLVNADSLSFIKTLPDNCIDLIATDPPYYRVKADKWDNQWATVTEYMNWLDAFFAEFQRVLKPAGSLYIFCSHKLISDTDILLRNRFSVLNHIVWAKPNGRWRVTRKENLRKYFPSTEHILFAEHYGADIPPRGQSGYLKECDALRRTVFAPLIEYFIDAREQLGISAAAIDAATGTQMCKHWFGYSQWQLPGEKHYLTLQRLFERVAEEKNCGESDIFRPYAGLQRQYDELRRPFKVTKDVPHTTVWTHRPVQFYPGKHPCEKPQQMMADIIRASSRPGDVVADFFMGQVQS